MFIFHIYYGGNNMNEEFLKTLTDEQMEKLKNCKTMEEMIAFAAEVGYELTDEDLKSFSGGFKVTCSTRCTCWGNSEVTY